MNEATPERFLPAYRAVQSLLRFMFRNGYGMRVAGLEHIPARGGCIIASNHESYLDPPVLGSAIPHRQVYFMAKKELFGVPILGQLLIAFGAFAVDRGSGDRRALDEAIRLLDSGRILGIYPEGTRSVDGSLGRGRTGVALLALRAGVPVVPAAVFHTGAAMRRRMLPGGRAFGIRFGPPIPIPRESDPSRARLLEVRDLIMAGIAAQLELGEPAAPGIPKEAS